MIDIRFVPLTKWPGDPTRDKVRAAFRAGYADTLRKLEYELGKLRAVDVVVEAFFRENQIRNDGWPYSKSVPSESGIILSFRTGEGSLSFPCDRYQTLDDNMRAIALSLAALRAVDRYGVTKRAEQYQGWKRIAAPPLAGFSNAQDAAQFIADYSGGNLKAVLENEDWRKGAYQLAAKRLHPDNRQTGNHDLFVKLGQALSFLEAR